MTGDINRLLRPKSIALIGGGAWGAQIIKQSQKMGFTGTIHVVHPKGGTVEGIRAVAMLSALPDVPDAVFIGVNRHATIEIVAELSAMGAGGAVCFASGFSEAGAEDGSAQGLQAQLVKAAGDMPILGPNCYGFINALDGALLWPDQHGCKRVEKGVAILTQSSNIAINLTMQQRGLPIAYMVTCGNMAQTRQAEIALALLDDPRVTAIGLHIEGFSDTGLWHRLALKAAAQNVPLIALKVGLSDQAQQATVSHTASLAGSDAGADALLRRLGIARVRDLPGFLETLKLLHVNGRLETRALSSVSCSGGEASLVADTAHGRAVTFPALSVAQALALRAALGPMVALSNPLDYNTYVWRDVDKMTAAWLPMAAPHIGLTLLIVDYPHTDASDWECATQAALNVRAISGRPVAVVATLPELMPLDVTERLLAGGVTPICGLTEAIAAAEAAAFDLAPDPVAPVQAGEERAAGLVSEGTAKQELAAFGLRIPKGRAADSPVEAAEIASDIGGLVVLKGQGLAHKSEVGAVIVGVHADGVQAAAQAMQADRFLVEEMITDPVAELLIGVVRDPAHGFVLTMGAGGVLAELWQDTVSLLLPVTPPQVAEALQRLRIAPLLNGYRGKPGADINAIIDAAMAVQAYVIAHVNTISEVEINPLICKTDSAIAVDALIRRT
jgi:acetyl-CoA synthetase